MSDLAKNASITLLTGIPGSGKTLRVVHYLKQAIEDGEVIFVSNLNGLKLPHIPFEDPREWRDLPPGSVLVVDEAQRFFRSRRSGEPPKYLTDMETIRHEGVRLILTTQQPDYLDTHLRGLVGLHEHLVREDGKQSVKIFRHNEVMENVRSEKARARYDNEVWSYPKDLFELYESAQVHTVKRTIKSRFKRGAVMAGAAVGLLVLAVWMFLGRFDEEGGVGISGGNRPDRAADASGREAGGAAARSAVPVSALALHEPAMLEEYFARLRPRAQQLPWSAPVYDDRQAMSEPRVFCVQGGEGVDAAGEYRSGGVSCMTEQGSRVVMAENAAQMLARWGEPYNPFKRPTVEHQAREDSVAPSVPVTAHAPVDGPRSVVGVAAGQASYGAINGSR